MKYFILLFFIPIFSFGQLLSKDFLELKQSMSQAKILSDTNYKKSNKCFG